MESGGLHGIMKGIKGQAADSGMFVVLQEDQWPKNITYGLS